MDGGTITLCTGWIYSVSDPAADSHIWYPYELVTVDGTLTAKALQDATSIKQYGYLYDIHAALSGKAVTPENCYDFEGAQGICPKGWHIPLAPNISAL